MASASSAGKRVAQGLAALAEGGADDGGEAVVVVDADGRGRAGTSRTTAESTFGGRNAPGGTVNSGATAQ